MSETEDLKKYVSKRGFSYRIARLGIILLAYLLYHPRFYGRDKIPKDGPVLLVAAPHRKLPDPGFVCLCTHRTVHFLAKVELFKGFFGFIFRLAQCIPVDRSKHDGQVVSAASEVLQMNQVVAIFPEGTRNRTDSDFLPFRYGAVSMAQRSNATIVPVYLKANYTPVFGQYKVYVGDPYKIAPDADLKEENFLLETKLNNLLKENR